MARKKWGTKFAVPGGSITRAYSQREIQEQLDHQLHLWRDGILRSPHMMIVVDEGLGRGWEIYERIDLRERDAEQQALKGPRDA